MRRRRSVKSRPDLGRRKSTSSVHSVHLQHIDPASAERDAHAAAFQAYTRARSRATSDLPLFPPTPETSPRRRQAERDTPSEESSSNPPRRRQSVRFVGPFSVQGKTGPGLVKRSPKETDQHPLMPQIDDDTDRSHRSVLVHLENSAPPPPQRRPPPPPPLPPVALPGISAGYIAALSAGDEYYTPEDDIASMPSSYRRLRRSRSMFTEERRLRNSQDSYRGRPHETPAACQPTADSTTKSPQQPGPKDAVSPRTTPRLRAPKSMSFLRNRRVLGGPRTSRDYNRCMLDLDLLEASEKPRGKTLTTAKSTPQLSAKPSWDPESKDRRADVAMPKSLRGESADDCAEADDGAMSIARHGSFKNRARKASKSLRTKLRSLFRHSRSEEAPPTIPAQHIESHRAYATDTFSSASGSQTAHQHAEDWGFLHRVPSKLPSVQDAPTNLLRSTRGSLEDLKNERERKVSDDRSLTSWIHSGPSTLTSEQQHQWREWEAQRLSTIGENGPHATSTSMSMRRPPLVSGLFNPTPATASQRIYSALMKRKQAIQDKNKDIAGQRPRNFEFRDSDTDGAATPKKPATGASLGSAKSSEGRTPKPVRLPAGSEATPTQGSRDVDYDTYGYGPTGRPLGPLTGYRGTHTYSTLGSAKQTGNDALTDGGMFEQGADVLASRALSPDPFTSRPAERAAPAEEGSSFADHGSEGSDTPNSHLFRTKTPYRRTLRTSIEEDRATKQGASSSRHQTLDDGPQIYVFKDGTVFNNHLARFNDQDNYSDSLYSTDDREGAKTHEAHRQPSAQNSGASSPPPYQQNSHHVNSSSSSVDWKAWLSANIAKLESSPPSPLRSSETEFALPTIPKNFSGGHVRERAQIHEDVDEDERKPEPPIRRPTLSTFPLATLEPNIVKPSPQQRSTKRAIPPSNSWPFAENESPSGAPPIPPKSALRPLPSPIRQGRGIASAAPSILSSPGLSAAVQRQFGPIAGYKAREVSEETSEDEEYLRNYRQLSTSPGARDAFL